MNDSVSHKPTVTHTPGPWRVRCTIDRGDDLAGTEEYFYIAAGAEAWADNKGNFHPDDARYPIDEFHVVELSSDRDYGYPEGGIRNKADAYLIAAAPEMLAACKAFLAAPKDIFSERTLFAAEQDILDMIYAAIEKAEGRS